MARAWIRSTAVVLALLASAPAATAQPSRLSPRPPVRLGPGVHHPRQQIPKTGLDIGLEFLLGAGLALSGATLLVRNAEERPRRA